MKLKVKNKITKATENCHESVWGWLTAPRPALECG